MSPQGHAITGTSNNARLEQQSSHGGLDLVKPPKMEVSGGAVLTNPRARDLSKGFRAVGPLGRGPSWGAGGPLASVGDLAPLCKALGRLDDATPLSDYNATWAGGLL